MLLGYSPIRKCNKNRNPVVHILFVLKRTIAVLRNSLMSDEKTVVRTNEWKNESWSYGVVRRRSCCGSIEQWYSTSLEVLARKRSYRVTEYTERYGTIFTLFQGKRKLSQYRSAFDWLDCTSRDITTRSNTRRTRSKKVWMETSKGVKNAACIFSSSEM